MESFRKIRAQIGWDLLPQFLRRIVAGVIGGTILLIGIALLVLPGPAFLVIPLGLLILGSEFAWARRLLRKARGLIGKTEDVPAKDFPDEERD